MCTSKKPNIFFLTMEKEHLTVLLVCNM
jgi:hypothetical protein